MHVAVMGAGSLGSLIGGLLATQHRVTLVGRDEHMRAVAEDGLRISGAIDRTVHPATTTSWSAVGSPDVGIVTVKNYDTRSAANEMQNYSPTTVLSIQNGIGNVEVLREVLGHKPEILVGTVTYGALLKEPGHVRCTGLGTIAIGSPNESRSPTAERLASAFTSRVLDCRAVDDMSKELWEKVAINAAINPVTALTGLQNGGILEDPLRPIALAAAREVARVARSRGHRLDVEETMGRVEAVARQTSENESSMARDVRNQSRTEIEAITGAVIERADPEQVPVNRVLYGLIVGYERAAGLRTD